MSTFLKIDEMAAAVELGIFIAGNLTSIYESKRYPLKEWSSHAIAAQS